MDYLLGSVVDLDPDPHILGPPGSDPLVTSKDPAQDPAPDPSINKQK